MILGERGVKMSKSLGNVINPDEIVKIYGADTLRVYEMFMGPFEQSVAWSTESIIGARRFIEKVWRIGQKVASPDAFAQVLGSPKMAQPDHSQKHAGSASQNFSGISPIQRLLHKTIKKVSEDIEQMHFNTAISSMMILATEMEKAESVQVEDYKKFLQILSPFAPHLTEELWQISGHKKSINFESWPICDLSKIQDEEVKIVAQVNGKVRAEIMIKADENEEDVKIKVLKNQSVIKHLAGRVPKKFIYVKNRLINIVI
jgi:leucyl-tRNA synthetase